MESININFLVSGTEITIPFSAICSITDKKFEGIIIIEYHPNKKVLEYVNAEKVIKNVCKKKLTVEELAYEIFKRAKESISPKYLKILVDVHKSDAHQPVQVWIEKIFKRR